MKLTKIYAKVLSDADVDVTKLLRDYIAQRLPQVDGIKNIAKDLGVTPSALNSELRRSGIKLTRKITLTIEEGGK